MDPLRDSRGARSLSARAFVGAIRSTQARERSRHRSAGGPESETMRFAHCSPETKSRRRWKQRSGQPRWISDPREHRNRKCRKPPPAPASVRSGVNLFMTLTIVAACIVIGTQLNPPHHAAHRAHAMEMAERLAAKDLDRLRDGDRHRRNRAAGGGSQQERRQHAGGPAVGRAGSDTLSRRQHPNQRSRRRELHQRQQPVQHDPSRLPPPPRK